MARTRSEDTLIFTALTPGVTKMGPIYEALENFEYAYQMREVKELSDNMNIERDRLRGILTTAQKLEKQALKNNNRAAYEKIKSVQNRLEKNSRQTVG